MNPRRFDAFTQAMASRPSRRAMMRGLLAGIAGLVTGGTAAEARPYSLDVGDPCIRNQQCIQDSDLGYAYCDDNGFAYDGPFNCCRYEGVCWDDAHCCVDRVCVGGRCRGWLGPGEECYVSDNCRADMTLICADNGVDYDGPRNCCAPYGGGCYFDEGCCGDLSCIGGACL